MESSSTSKPPAAHNRLAQRLAAPRLKRELDTVAAMLGIYCRDHHASAAPCDDCAALLDYARKRLAGCTYGPHKPTCVNCPIHCYAARQREAMRTVMRYAGPRMLWRHPWLALRHLIDGRRPAPPRPGAKGSVASHSEPPDPH